MSKNYCPYKEEYSLRKVISENQLLVLNRVYCNRSLDLCVQFKFYEDRRLNDLNLLIAED